MKKCAIMAALVLALSACGSTPAPVTNDTVNSTDNGNSVELNPNDECPRADGTPCR